jgi:3-methyladenine DNA glycosylase AlkD
MKKAQVFIAALEKEFNRHSNNAIATAQAKYMKNNFDFFGIKTPERREIMRPFLHKNYLPEKTILPDLIKQLWQKPEREFHYFGQELLFKYQHKLAKDDIKLIHFMLTNQSWWDTVDYIAIKILGTYFKQFPSQIGLIIPQWLASDNIWLQRSALLFQLKYKVELNTNLLADSIQKLLGSKEFFIDKAIGWILREHSKTDPQWVVEFVDKTDLAVLSKREALRLIN